MSPSNNAFDAQPIWDGGPAFPMNQAEGISFKTVDEWQRGMRGMSLRDYFAAEAMGPILGDFRSWMHDGETLAVSVARNAYEMADAMLKERQAS